MVTGLEAVKEVKKFIERRCPNCGRSKADLVITDVPKDTLKLFRDIANSDEFTCNDKKGGHYGFALKAMVDCFIGRYSNAGYEELENRIEKLENKEAAPIDKVISVSGEAIRTGG